MGKTISKKKKSKRASRLKRQMGALVVAGLSLVLTVSMAVGSTLAWFAGSTWASKDLYLGGPVYLEMSGDGADYTKSGSGNLSIEVSGRSSGTNDNYNNGAASTGNTDNVMLPGQRVSINSYARIFSTGTTDSVADSTIVNNSSGNVSNNSGNSTGTASYYGNSGTVTTSTTSVLRAKYSLSVEFDPSTGFNNFTSAAYQANYPKQHQQTWTYEAPTWKTYETYTDGADSNPKTDPNIVTEYTAEGAEGGAYKNALADSVYDVIQVKCVARYEKAGDATAAVSDTGAFKGYKTCVGDDGYTYILAKLPTDKVTCYMRANIGRRDAVLKTAGFSADVFSTFTAPDGAGKAMVVTEDKTAGILNNTVKPIYKWKYVSKSVYLSYGKYDENHKGDIKYWTPGKANMLGSIGIKSIDTHGNITANGYGIWILNDKTTNKEMAAGYVKADSTTDAAYYYQESDAFYKARCNAYLQSYTEYYQTEYGDLVDRNIASSLQALDNSLNNEFVRLINESSTTIKKAAGDGGLGWNAEWMYIDTVAGNDTNASEMSTSVGGWWYLVASNNDKDDTSYYTAAKGWKKGTVTASTEPAGHFEVKEAEGGKTYALYKKFIKEALKNEFEDAEKAKLNNGYNLNFTANTEIYYNDINGDGALDEGEYYTVKVKPKSGTSSSQYFQRLSNLLYEVVPDFGADEKVYSTNGNQTVYKVFSESIPFVNGSFILPPDELTNVFSNARVTIQVSFQAIQAFLPYTKTIDVLGKTSVDSREGREKALTIQNAIYVFNEAFDYTEGATDFEGDL